MAQVPKSRTIEAWPKDLPSGLCATDIAMTSTGKLGPMIHAEEAPAKRSLVFRRRLRCQHPLCRFNVDERISIEMCRDDIRPLIKDLMKGVVIRNVENRNRAPPHASIALPTYTSCFVPGNPRPERLPGLCELGRPLRPRC